MTTARIRLVNLQRAHPIPRRRVAATAVRILKRFRIQRGEFSITFVGAQRMQRLNHRYHHRDRLTDVLAFDLRLPAQRRGRVMVGEVIIAPAVAAREAAHYGQRYAEELLTYVAHGMLHLLGYRDGTPRERRRMEQLQNIFVRTQTDSR